MAITPVPQVAATPATFASVISSLGTAGTIVVLDDGDYGAWTKNDTTYSPPLTIRARNSRKATFTKITFGGTNGVDNVTLQGLSAAVARVDPDLSTQMFWNFTNCSNIQLRDCSFTSYIAPDTDYDAGSNAAMCAIKILQSSSCIIRHCEFQWLNVAITLDSCDDVLVEHCLFHDLYADCLNCTEQDGLIWRHTTAYRWRSKTWHPDTFQFWTVSSAHANTNIEYRENIAITAGGGWFQGPFMQVNPGYNFPFSQLTFIDNLIVTQAVNALRLEGETHYATIANNTVLADFDAYATPNVEVYSAASDNIEITDTACMAIIGAGLAGTTQSGNLVLQRTDTGGANYLEDAVLDWRGGLDPWCFLPRPSGVLDAALGASTLLRNIRKPAIIIDVTRDADLLAGMTVTLEATAFGVLPKGSLSYHWNFGDGTTGTGQSVEHTFSASGNYTIRCTVAGSNRSEMATRTILVRSPLLIDMALSGLPFANAGEAGGAPVVTGTLDYTGSVLNFDGTNNNWARLEGISDLLSGITQLSFGATINVDPTTGDCVFGLLTAYDLRVLRSPGRLYVGLSTSDGAFPVTATTSAHLDGNPHEVVFTYDAATGVANIYLDGSIVGTRTGITGRVAFASGRNVCIGNQQGTSFPFKGSVSDLWICAGIVTPAAKASTLTTLRAIPGRPKLSSVATSNLTATSVDINLTTDGSDGEIHAICSTVSTRPAAINLVTGLNNSLAFNPEAHLSVSSAGTKTLTISGLTSGTTYYPFVTHRDARRNFSVVAAISAVVPS